MSTAISAESLGRRFGEQVLRLADYQRALPFIEGALTLDTEDSPAAS